MDHAAPPPCGESHHRQGAIDVGAHDQGRIALGVAHQGSEVNDSCQTAELRVVLPGRALGEDRSFQWLHCREAGPGHRLPRLDVPHQREDRVRVRGARVRFEELPPEKTARPGDEPRGR